MGRRGAVLICCYLFIMVLLAFGSATLIRGSTEQRAIQQDLNLLRAFHAAETGVDRAIMNLRTNNNANITSTPFMGATYWAEIASLGSLRYLITAHGLVNHQRDIEAVVQQTPQPVFQYAVFGYDQLDLKNSAITDSYDSTQGNYNPSSPGSKGHIGTNNTATHSVKLSNGAAINGQVVVGTGMADPTTAVDNQGSIITGTPPIVSMTQALAQPLVSPPLSCGGKLELKNGETGVLPDDGIASGACIGKQCCYEEVLVDNSSVLAVSGNVMLYTGKLVVKNDAQVNYSPTSKPAPKLIVQITSTKQVLVDNSAKFVGAIYAPNANADVKNSAIFYGSIVAKDVKVDNSARIHYDEALRNVNGPAGSYQLSVLSWHEP